MPAGGRRPGERLPHRQQARHRGAQTVRAPGGRAAAVERRLWEKLFFLALHYHLQKVKGAGFWQIFISNLPQISAIFSSNITLIKISLNI